MDNPHPPTIRSAVVAAFAAIKLSEAAAEAEFAMFAFADAMAGVGCWIFDDDEPYLWN